MGDWYYDTMQGNGIYITALRYSYFYRLGKVANPVNNTMFIQGSLPRGS